MIITAEKKQILTAKQKQALKDLRLFLANQDYEVGDQIASVATISKRIRTSVSVLTKVLPILIEEGILESIPNIGTFIKKLPHQSVQLKNNPSRIDILNRLQQYQEFNSTKEKTIIRFQINEMDDYSGNIWRSAIRCFEEQHPNIQVAFTIANHNKNIPNNRFLAEPDIIYNTVDLLDNKIDCFQEWIDTDFLENSKYMYDVTKDFLLQSSQKKVCPLVFGFHTLMANRSLLDKTGLYTPQKWQSPSAILETCRQFRLQKILPTEQVMGCIIPHYFATTGTLPSSNIFSPNDIEKSYHELERFLNDLAYTPIPDLITRDDVYHDNVSLSPSQYTTGNSPFFEMFRETEFLFLIGAAWYKSFFDPAEWVVLPYQQVTAGPAEFNIMGAAISNNTKNVEEAQTFLKFLVSREGQDILSQLNGLLPARNDCDNSQQDLLNCYKETVKKGWNRENFYDYYNSQWQQLKDSFNKIASEVRTQRKSVSEALNQLKEAADSANLECYQLN